MPRQFSVRVFIGVLIYFAFLLALSELQANPVLRNALAGVFVAGR